MTLSKSPAGAGSALGRTHNSHLAPISSLPRHLTRLETSASGTSHLLSRQISPQNSARILRALHPPSMNAAIVLSATAIDPDGDKPQVTWTQISPSSPLGRWSSTTGSQVSWATPPISADTDFTFRATLSDGNVGAAQHDVTVHVINLPNVPPDVSPLQGTESALAGEPVTLSLKATDIDLDPLAITWEQVSPTDPAHQGVFVKGQGTSSLEWRSSDISQRTTFVFRVSVSDGHAPAVVQTWSTDILLPSYQDVEKIFYTACDECHIPPTNAGGLVLEVNHDPYSRLVNVQAQSSCTSMKRVAPGNPDNSVLVRKISGTSCGSRMPRNRPSYFDTYPGRITRIRSWILGGATR